MSSARVARRPSRTNSPAAVRAMWRRVRAVRRSVNEPSAAGSSGNGGGGVGVVLLSFGRLCPCGTICHLAGHPGVQVRGDPLGETANSRARRPGGQAPDPAREVPAQGGWCVGTWRVGRPGARGPEAFRLLGSYVLFPGPVGLKRRGTAMFARSSATRRTLPAPLTRPRGARPSRGTSGARSRGRPPRRRTDASVTPPRRTRWNGPASSAPAARASRSGGCARASGRAPCRPRSACARGRPRCRSAS
ncbi:hypothetical protein GA0115245_11158 [Streptomyces sp. di188]|nr:hypothetical protein GA0115238_11907 [Streptomyces sp. di50b]SCD68114.1 hypothetical protein GA0115245_11158 [Streptomyces sp. di188]